MLANLDRVDEDDTGNKGGRQHAGGNQRDDNEGNHNGKD